MTSILQTDHIHRVPASVEANIVIIQADKMRTRRHGNLLVCSLTDHEDSIRRYFRFVLTIPDHKEYNSNAWSKAAHISVVVLGRVKHFWSLVSSCCFTDLRKNLLRRMWRVCTFKTFSPSLLNFFLKLKYLAVKTESVELMRTGTAKSTFSQSPGA